MKRALLWWVCVGWCTAVPLVAQSSAPIQRGGSASASLAAPSWSIEIVSALPDQLPRPRGPSDTQRRAMQWGAAVGAVAGLVIGIAAMPDDCAMFRCVLAPVAVPLVTAAGAAVGAGVGLIVGTIIDERGDRSGYVSLAITVP